MKNNEHELLMPTSEKPEEIMLPREALEDTMSPREEPDDIMSLWKEPEDTMSHRGEPVEAISSCEDFEDMKTTDLKLDIVKSPSEDLEENRYR